MVEGHNDDAGAARSSRIQVIERVGRILRALESAPGGMPLVELAQTVAMPKSTVHRLVSALEAEELVSSFDSGRVRLGRGLARLGAATRDGLRDQVRPFLEQLRDEVDETVDLAILSQNTMRFIDQVPAPHRLRAVSAIGSSFPLHCTANGKAMLAALSRQEAEAYLPTKLVSCTPASITTRRALWQEIEAVRAQGFAIDREEHSAGICAVGAVVWDPFGPAAAITIPVPAARFAGQEDRLIKALAGTVTRCSAYLGTSLPVNKVS